MAAAERQAGSHFGLKIMQARAGQLSGSLHINSAVGHGTRITLAWPIMQEGAATAMTDHTTQSRHELKVAAPVFV